MIDPDAGGLPGTEESPALLASALEQLRLAGAIFFRSELTEPFAFESTPLAMAEALHPGADRLLLFHIVAGGSCWVEAVDGERHWATDGDIIVLPYGDRHTIGGRALGPVRTYSGTARPPALDQPAVAAPWWGWRPHRARLRLSVLRRSTLRPGDASPPTGLRCPASSRRGIELGPGEHRVRARACSADECEPESDDHAVAGAGPDRGTPLTSGHGSRGRPRMVGRTSGPGTGTGARSDSFIARPKVDRSRSCVVFGSVAFTPR